MPTASRRVPPDFRFPPSAARFLPPALCLLLWLLFLGFLALHLLTPSDGARVPPGQAAALAGGLPLEPLRPGGVEAGDVLLAVNGHSVAELARTLSRPGPTGITWTAGQSLRYTVERGGVARDVSVTLGAYPLGAVLANNWGSIMFALVGQLAMALLYWRRPDEPV